MMRRTIDYQYSTISDLRHNHERVHDVSGPQDRIPSPRDYDNQSSDIIIPRQFFRKLRRKPTTDAAVEQEKENSNDDNEAKYKLSSIVAEREERRAQEDEYRASTLEREAQQAYDHITATYSRASPRRTPPGPDRQRSVRGMLSVYNLYAYLHYEVLFACTSSPSK
jgi:hypothetical protein